MEKNGQPYIHATGNIRIRIRKIWHEAGIPVERFPELRRPPPFRQQQMVRPHHGRAKKQTRPSGKQQQRQLR